MAAVIAISSFPHSGRAFFVRVMMTVFAPRKYFHLGCIPILVSAFSIRRSSSEAVPVGLNGSTDLPGTVSRILFFENPSPKSIENSASVPKMLI